MEDFFNVKDLNCNKVIHDNKYLESITCPECQSDENYQIVSEGNVICILCGIVINKMICDSAEWNNYTDSSGFTKNNSRCGTGLSNSTDINPFIRENSSFIPKGSSCIIYKNGKSMRYDVSKIHIKKNSNHRYKSFNQVELHLENIGSDKYPDDIIITAKKIWAEILNIKKTTRAGVRKGLLACCLYYACINHDCTRTPIEICKDFGMSDTKQFNKGNKEFKEIFEQIPKWSYLLTKSSDSDDYFARLTCELEMNNYIPEGSAFSISIDCKEKYKMLNKELACVFPKTAACGLILWNLKHKNIQITKLDLSKTLDICIPSITKCYKIIVSKLGNP